MNWRAKALFYTTSVLGCTLLAAPTYAQSSDPVPAGNDEQGGLTDIIVTARKREESAQSVPVAITAISEKTIELRDITSIEKIANTTPSLTVGRASNGSSAQLTLRGIGSSSTSIGIEQSVAVVVDGVYYGQGRIIEEGFFDLAGVEILKGPQVLFFGKNATAGVISIKTADPTPDWQFKARAGYEVKSQKGQLEFVASGPLSDTLGVRFAVRGSKMWGGYYTNVSTPITLPAFGTTSSGGPYIAPAAAKDQPGEKELMGRVTLKYDPTDALTMTLKGSFDYNQVNNSSWNYVAYHCPGGTSALAGYTCGSNFVTHQNEMPVEEAANFPFARKDGRLYNKYRSAAVTGTIDYKLGDVTLTSVTNYNWNNNSWMCDCEFQANPFLVLATEDSSWRAFSSEFRTLTNFEAPVNVMLGVLYQSTKRDFDQLTSFSFSNIPAAGPYQYVDKVTNSFTKGETIAGFGQVTWKILPSVELAGGVRYTHETKDSSFLQPYISPAFSAIWVGGRTTTANQVFNNWSPEASLTWKPTSNILVYAAYKTGYKSGGFSNGGIDSAFGNPAKDLVFGSEKAQGFEGGIKSTLFDRQLRLNLSLYSYAYNDLQIDFFNSSIIAFQTLTADARTKGVELEFEFAPRSLPGLNIHGDINYNRARYTKFPAAPCYAGETPGEGCNLIFDGALGGYRGITAGEVGQRQNLTGISLSVAPEWTAAFGVGYETSVSAGMMAGVNVDVRYSSSYLSSGFGALDSRQDSYATLDAGVRIGAADDNWQFAVIGKNLTNKQYFTGGVDGPNTGSGTGTSGGIHADQFGFGNLPRTVELQFTKRF